MQELTNHLRSVCVRNGSLFPVSQPRKPAQRRAPINASTADEAIEKMLEQKRISTKINYDVLKDLNRSSVKSPPSKPKESPARAAQRRTPSVRPHRVNELSASLATPASIFGKRYCVYLTHAVHDPVFHTIHCVFECVICDQTTYCTIACDP